jgi:carbamoyl-phosphate synthase large subunit
MNTLFVSAGRRVELLKAFTRAYADLGLSGMTIAVDADRLAPALRVADRALVVPRSTNPRFIEVLAEVCRREEAALVFPLIDPDIEILARYRGELEATGARVVVVPEWASRVAMDKLRTYEHLTELDIPTPVCWTREQIDADDLEYPVFIKPRFGSASEHTYKVCNPRELDFFLDYVPEPVVQEYVRGPEITSDVLCDFEGDVLAVVSRRRIAVRSGEVSKGITVFDPEIIESCVRIAQSLEAIGPITIQCLLRDGQPLFTEVNARFGGGFPLALAAGVDSPRWLLALAAGVPVEVPPLGSYKKGLHLTRFDDSFFVTSRELDRVESHRL